MANTKLINKLSKKWSKPGGMPHKGSAIDDNCNPCAQSEAVMMATGMGNLDFKAFLLTSREGLDRTAAKTLGISVPHAILLRRFNDSSSLSPALALKNPAQILGSYWKEVLKFWSYLDSRSAEDWTFIELSEIVRCVNDGNSLDEDGLKKLEEWKAKKKKVNDLMGKLNIVVPNIYREIGSNAPTTRKNVRSTPSHKVTPAENYCWKASWDYCISNGITDLARSIPTLVAYAACEIQCLSSFKCYDELYFCKILGYDPFKDRPVRDFAAGLRNKVRALIRTLTANITKIDNKVFIASRGKKDQTVNKLDTTTFKLSLEDLTPEGCVEKIKSLVESMLITKNNERLRNTVNITVTAPFPGDDTVQERHFHLLISNLREKYLVQSGPTSCIVSPPEYTRKFNAPKDYPF